MLTKRFFVRCGDLRDRQARGRRDLADDAGHLVALDHALGLGGGGLRVDRVFLEELDLAADDAAGGVDLVHRHVGGHHGIFAERAEEAGARRQVADLDGVRLGAANGGKSHDAGRQTPHRRLAPTMTSRRDTPLRVVIIASSKFCSLQYSIEPITIGVNARRQSEREKRKPILRMQRISAQAGQQAHARQSSAVRQPAALPERRCQAPAPAAGEFHQPEGCGRICGCDHQFSGGPRTYGRREDTAL